MNKYKMAQEPPCTNQWETLLVRADRLGTIFEKFKKSHLFSSDLDLPGKLSALPKVGLRP